MICCNKYSNFYFLNYKYVFYLNTTHSEEADDQIDNFINVNGATTILNPCFIISIPGLNVLPRQKH